MQHVELRPGHLQECLDVVPLGVRGLMVMYPESLVLAGGLLRSRAAGEEVADIDLFASGEGLASRAAAKLAAELRLPVTSSGVARTILTTPYPVQVVGKWNFSSPQELLARFDFTIAMAALWYDGTSWRGLCDARFYGDVDARRLRYTSPLRREEPAGSFMRLLKFYRLGYRASVGDLGAVLARLSRGVGEDAWSLAEEEASGILVSLLRRADDSSNRREPTCLP